MAVQSPNTPSGVNATGLPIPHPHLTELVARKKLRQKVQRAVSRLINVLDALDTDPDLEDETDANTGDDEPPYGWTPSLNQERAIRDCRNDTGAEGEPSLGAPEHHPDVMSYGTRLWVDHSASQARWAQGTQQDLEFGGAAAAEEDIEDDDPGGGDVLDEVHDGYLGWHGNVDQSDLGDAREAELDPTDCIERYRGRREMWPAHTREAEAQADALKRRLSGQAPRNGSNVPGLTPTVLAALLRGERHDGF